MPRSTARSQRHHEVVPSSERSELDRRSPPVRSHPCAPRSCRRVPASRTHVRAGSAVPHLTCGSARRRLHRIRCGRVCEPPMKIFVGRAVLTSPPSIPRARAMPPAVASGQSAVPAARDSRSVASVRVAAHEVARPRRSSCGRRGGRAAPLTLCDHPDCPLHVCMARLGPPGGQDASICPPFLPPSVPPPSVRPSLSPSLRTSLPSSIPAALLHLSTHG